MVITQSNRDFYNEFKDGYTHIISIVCPDEKELVNPIHKNHLIIKMWDVDKVIENKFRRYDPPDFLTVMSAVGWAQEQFLNSIKKGEVFKLLIHCDAGVSRSTALALGVMWRISENIFGPEIRDPFLKLYLDARKQWCKALLDWNVSVGLCRYIDGRYNPVVKPNQAILKILKENLDLFPW